MTLAIRFRSHVLFLSTVLFLAIPASVDAGCSPASRTWDWFFGLTGSSTVGEYLSSGSEETFDWRMDACCDGVCLNKVDWKCGFTNGDEETHERCMESLIPSLSPSERLGRVARYCGIRGAKFVGTTDSTPDECESAGGRWGVKSKPPRLKFK